MALSKLAIHARGKEFRDEVFLAIAGVQEAIKREGKARVLDATIGSLCDEEGGLVFLPTVEKVFRGLPGADIVAYANARGISEYLNLAIQQTFKDHRPDAYLEAVATAGGSGAIHNWIWNYSDDGDAVLTHDWHWQPYQVICDDIHRRLETFTFFDEQQRFNAASFQSKVQELLTWQDNLVIVLNTPNHNPTGYSLSDEEWDEVLGIASRHAKGAKTIALLVDTAYIDYLMDPNAGRGFMGKFSHLPANVIAGFAFSMSKGFTLYGQRTGALIGVSSDRQTIDEFVNAATITNRARWSNISRGAMQTMIEIYRNPILLAQVEQERQSFVALMEQRAAVFMEEARAASLHCLPYCGGFFISVPTADSLGVSGRLNQDNIFTVPLAKGLRIAVCAVPVKKMQGLAARIANAVQATMPAIAAKTR